MAKTQEPTWLANEDGSCLEIRPICAEDDALLLRMEGFSNLKFRPPRFGTAPRLSRQQLVSLCRFADERDMGLIAVFRDAQGEFQAVGVCRFFADSNSDSAEIALEVAESWRQHGVSNRLIKPLITIARERGLCKLVTSAEPCMMSIATKFAFIMTGRCARDACTSTAFEVVRDLQKTRDLGEYNPAHISDADVRLLVTQMYTGKVAKEEVKLLFLEMDRARVVRLLDELAGDESPEFRSNAIELLVFLEGPRSFPWIEKCLQDADDGFRCAGCSFLAEVAGPEAIDRLVRCLREDPSGSVRYAAVEGLEDCCDMSAIPALEFAMTHDAGTDFEGRPISERAEIAIQRIRKAGTT